MMKAHRTGCRHGNYLQIRNILSQAPLPTFVLAGDNDYLDCPKPSEAWTHYMNTFSDFDEDWMFRLPAGVPTLAVDRWLQPENVPLQQNVTRWTTRPEMFSFSEDGILFLSMTLMHVPDDLPPDALFQERLADSKRWVAQEVTEASMEHKNRGERLRGVVMFGHAMITGYLRPFFMELKQIFYEAVVVVPVLYIHGDGHKFNINENLGPNLLGWNQFVDIQVRTLTLVDDCPLIPLYITLTHSHCHFRLAQVDQGAYADPLLIEVALLQGGSLMQALVANNPNQFIVGGGLFRVDRQDGRYPSIEDEDV